MKKILKRVLVVLLILVLAITGIGANYLVDFAIKRKESTPDIVPTSIVSDEGKNQMAKNWEGIAEKTAVWLDTVDLQTVSRTSPDGLNLVADIAITDPESHRWLLAVHGYTGNRTNLRSIACYYADWGFNVLFPDLRASGDSDGDYIGMGWPDRLDQVDWINYIIAMDPEAEIILHGISMGGGTVMMTSGEELPENVKAIVEDCGYTDVWSIFSDELAYLFHLPEFPILYVADSFSKFKTGYGFKEASSLNQVKKCKVPMLFIHGSADNFVHTEMVYDVYDACPTEKELLVVEGAGHGNSYMYDPDLYFGTIENFIGRYLN